MVTRAFSWDLCLGSLSVVPDSWPIRSWSTDQWEACQLTTVAVSEHCVRVQHLARVWSLHSSPTFPRRKRGSWQNHALLENYKKLSTFSWLFQFSPEWGDPCNWHCILDDSPWLLTSWGLLHPSSPCPGCHQAHQDCCHPPLPHHRWLFWRLSAITELLFARWRYIPESKSCKNIWCNWQFITSLGDVYCNADTKNQLELAGGRNRTNKI